jgi:hypothetical protein
VAKEAFDDTIGEGTAMVLHIKLDIPFQCEENKEPELSAIGLLMKKRMRRHCLPAL